jgi:hypothetical protein
MSVSCPRERTLRSRLVVAHRPYIRGHLRSLRVVDPAWMGYHRGVRHSMRDDGVDRRLRPALRVLPRMRSQCRTDAALQLGTVTRDAHASPVKDAPARGHRVRVHGITGGTRPLAAGFVLPARAAPVSDAEQQQGQHRNRNNETRDRLRWHRAGRVGEGLSDRRQRVGASSGQCREML